MHDILVKPLPPGCRLTAIFDCCHSGSVLDLPYEYVTASAGAKLMTLEHRRKFERAEFNP